MSVLAALIGLLALAVMGASTATVMSTHQASRSATFERQGAEYLAQAGLEYGLMQIANGGYPNTTKTLGSGTFTVQVVPASHLVRSIGTFGQATQEYQITDNALGGDCISVNNLLATLTGNNKDELHGITLVKTCLNSITIDTWVMTWNPSVPSEKVTEIVMVNPSNVIWSDPAGVSSGQLINSTNFTISDNVTQVHEIQFVQNMRCKLFSMTVTFTDGSTATMPQTLLGTGQCP